jgi:energy-converting hydrogenase Eha subunit F
MLKNTGVFEPVLWWLYAAIAVTGVCATIYLAVQQNYRQSLNDPQIQIAEDAAARLDAGDVPAAVVPRMGSLVNLDTSLATWVAVYDASGLPLESSGQLDNAPPQPPKNLFDPSTWRSLKTFPQSGGNETRVTWQPRDGVRQALIIVHAQNGMFVVSGRNMRTTEDRIIQLGENMLLAWAFTLGCLLVASFVGWRLLRR